MRQLTRIILRNPLLISFLGFLSIGICSLYAVKLYSQLKPDLEELLPLKARSVLDYQEIARRLTSTDKITLLIQSKDTAASKKFVIDLAQELQKAPKNIIDSVEYEIQKDIAFFNKKKALFIELQDLTDIRNFIQKKIDYEIELYNPINIFRSTELPEPKYNFNALEKKYKDQASTYTDFPDGFYATADESMRLIHINLPSTPSKIEAAYTMRAAIDEALKKIRPESYGTDFTLLFTGGAQELIEEHKSLMKDLLLTTLIVVFLVSCALFYYYQSFRGTLLLILSLLIGTLWTFTATFFTIGYLNANSAFLGSIIIGNGVNYGIILLARYFEERRKNKNHIRSLYSAMDTTYMATVLASLTAAFSYGSLCLTDFRGFQQFGLIGLMGMILCWLSAYVLLPAFLTLNNRAYPLVIRNNFFMRLSLYGRFNNWIVSRFPKAVLLTSFILTIFSILFFINYKEDIIESDLTKLRDKESMTHGAGAHYKNVSKIFPGYPHPLVILAQNQEEAFKVAERFREEKKKPEIAEYIATVTSLDTFVPTQQKEKIQVLESIQKILPPRYREQLPPTEKKLLAEFLNTSQLTPFTQNDLPPFVKSKMTEANGALGNLVLIEPPKVETTQKADGLIRFIDLARSIADSVRANIPVAGQIAISADLITAIKVDGPKATLFSFIAVIILVFIFFRNIFSSMYVLFALFFGVLWLMGAIYGFNIKINFLNFIALPITFGIGVDYAVNIYQRYREDGQKNILDTLSQIGPAVTLASLTTTIGYGGLLIAGNQAFVSFGLIAVIGELTCLFAALYMLPAILYLLEKK